MMVLIKANNTTPIIALDDGHGMSTAGKRSPILPAGLKSETGNFMHENEFNRAVVKYLKAELIRCGFKTVEVAPTDADTPLSTRVKTANNAKADLYLSIHANANTGKWNAATGIETLAWDDAKSQSVAKVFHNYIKGGTPQRDRGLKDGDWLYVVRNTDMIALLFEFGFMDNLNDIKLLLSDAYRRESAVELAKATCEVFGKKYVPAKATSTTTAPKKTAEKDYPFDTSKGIGTVQILAGELNVRKGPSFDAPVIDTLNRWYTFYVYETKNGLHRVSNDGWISANEKYVKFTAHPKPKELYRVQVGAFSSKGYADNLARDLAAKGYEGFVKQVGTLYKVQVGAFSVKANAENLQSQLKKLGFDTFIVLA